MKKGQAVNDTEVIEASVKFLKDARDLVVFKKAFALSLEIHKISLSFPKIEQYALADQLRRSSKSVCANLAEGFPKQKYSSAEFGRYIGIAEASTGETQVWLQYALALGYIPNQQFLELDNSYSSIKAMLYKLRKSL